MSPLRARRLLHANSRDSSTSGGLCCASWSPWISGPASSGLDVRSWTGWLSLLLLERQGGQALHPARAALFLCVASMCVRNIMLQNAPRVCLGPRTVGTAPAVKGRATCRAPAVGPGGSACCYWNGHGGQARRAGKFPQAFQPPRLRPKGGSKTLTRIHPTPYDSMASWRQEKDSNSR